MPRIIPNNEFTTLLEVVARYPDAVAVSDLLAQPEISFTKRTLQRRIDALLESGHLKAIGEGRGRRYYVAPTEIDKWQTQLAEDAGISLSREAIRIRAQVTRPVTHRDPVGYKDAFLDQYVPNKSAYLSDSLRKELAIEGRVGASQLPAGTYVRKVLDRLLIDLSWNSSRLEGNTYSILETERLLQHGEVSEGKNSIEAQMLLNHKAAIELLADQADEIGFNHYTICNLHALLSDNLMVDPDGCGRIRERSVGIGASVYYPPEGHLRIKERFDVFLEKADAIQNPFEQSFFAMVHLPYLQAFEDVNKRVSRLAANIPLVRHNLCPLSFVDVPQSDYLNGIIGVYELNRIEYLRDVFVWAYKRSAMRYAAVRETLGEPDPFRLTYRNQIHQCVREIVQQHAGREAAEAAIEAHAQQFDLAVGERFREVIKVELRSLHEGNIARYRLRPKEFAAWQQSC
ncbi:MULTISPECIES: Fic family protein [unclassified Lentimonas]|uniref:Fic family protein n=1 Tax=unclassified Lentimonas TaxID=2630993 RepID=UPI0013263EA9|nr:MULTISPECIES: Fic family protein [unclassified Lentimonas]CAA6694983.1 FIG00923625: hypothetical protein [Lentimonas sp. CC19]CAA6695339.1 FIG00923625: hypothetical protein [Lentimonas sp. CC10]CAA7072015.1 FIG00923625: hypothetical protein [Lentimonas sp. CC11]